MQTFEENLPLPVFLMIFRNPFSVSESLIKHDPNFDFSIDSYKKGLNRSLNDYLKFTKYLDNFNVPIITVEHEKIVKNPELFIREFVDTLNIETDNETIKKAIYLISKPGYKSVNFKG